MTINQTLKSHKSGCSGRPANNCLPLNKIGDDKQKSSGSSASCTFPPLLPPPKLQGVTCLPGARLGGRGIKELLPGALGVVVCTPQTPDPEPHLSSC